MNVETAKQLVINAGRGMHDGYQKIGKDCGPYPENDLGEQIAIGLYAIGRFISGKHAIPEADIAKQIVVAEIMAGRLPAMNP